MTASDNDPLADASGEIVLGVLNAVGNSAEISQRSIARDLGIALGLANTYLKRCVKKGYIKVTEVPARRYAYYLTPHGFMEKSRLTTEFLSQSLSFFRQTRSQCEALLAQCHALGRNRVMLCGIGEVAEIAIVFSRENHISITAIYDPGQENALFHGVPVISDLALAPPCDAVILTALRDPLPLWRQVAARHGRDRVLVPAILGLPALELLDEADA